jgi:O-antigen ligase
MKGNLLRLSLKSTIGSVIPCEYGVASVLAVSLLATILGCVTSIAFGIECFVIPVLILVTYFSFKYGMFLFCIFLITTPLAGMIFPNYSIKYSFLLVLVFLFFWIARKMILPREKLKLSVPLVVFSIAFMFVVLISALNYGLSAKEIMSIVKLSIFFLLVYAIYDIYQPRHLFWIMLSASIPMVIISFMLLLSYVQAGGWVAWVGLYRAKGGSFPGNVNAMAFIILILSLYWIALDIWCQRKAIRRFSGFMSVYLTFSLILTGARASFLGFILSALIFSYWAKKLKYLIVICLIGIVVLLSIPIFQTLFSVVFRFDTDISGRDEIWLNSIDMIKKDFWFGVGISNYQQSYRRYMDTIIWHYKLLSPSAHNQILDFMAELGIMGLPMILILYYLPIRKGMISLRKTRSIDDRGVIYGLLGALIAVYGRSIFEGGGMLIRPFLYPSILFWIILIVFLKIEESRDPQAGSIFFGHLTRK